MADSKTKKPATKKPAAKKPAAKAQPVEATDADVVTALMKVQKRNLSSIDFAAVTRTIKLLS